MKTIILSLIASSLLLIGCSGGGGGSSGGSSSAEPLLNTTTGGGGDGNNGGGGDGNNGGGGGNGNGSNGDGGGERPSFPAEVQLSISPFIDGLRIQWHNLSAIEGAGGIYIHLNLTGGNPPQPDERKIAIEDFSDDSYEIDGLDNGTAYRLVGVRVEQANNTFWVIDNITWSELWEAKTNALDNNGGGIVVGANHDGDGRADGVDEDDDGDGKPNDRDACRLGIPNWPSTNRSLDYDGDGCRNDEDWDNDNDGVNNTRADGTTVWDVCRQGELGWMSDNISDHDGDGCRDEGTANNGHGEDTDDDNDRVEDSMDSCRLGELGWTSNGMTDHDGDGCRDEGTANNGHGEDTDDDNDGVDDVDEEAGCRLSSDCDNDMVLDVDEAMGCAKKPNCDDDYLIDSEDSCPNGEQGWNNNDGTNDNDSDGCRNDEDIDDDGDGLIEISMPAELDAVRWVLNGTGFKVNEGAVLNQTGCGNGMNMTVCNGYELMGNISLTDYIADNYPMVGWQPIAHDVNLGNTVCDGDKFTSIFDGNGFVISGLFINRSQQHCIGLFGQANEMIRNLGVIADRIIGSSYVGSLVGDGSSAKIIQSYAVSGVVHGTGWVGGLMGRGLSASIVQSYAVSSIVVNEGTPPYVGGLIGFGQHTKVIQSYAIHGGIRGDHSIGGLIGEGRSTVIIQSYAMGVSYSFLSDIVGGLVGIGRDAEIVQSYTVSGTMSKSRAGGTSNVGGLVGFRGTATASYWDTETSGRTNSATGSGQTTSALRSPTGYTNIYATWDDGAISEGTTIAGVDHNGTIWCDEDLSGRIEDNERRDNNRVWDFGSATDYPALRCTPDSLTDQRAWWSLNSIDKPELDQDRLDDYLDGTLP